MNWNNLKKFQCPKCKGALEPNASMTGYMCTCGFFVTNGKFDAIVNKMYKESERPNYDPDRNLSELNNL